MNQTEKCCPKCTKFPNGNECFYFLCPCHTEKKDDWRNKPRVLNKYVIEADTDHNRWTFQGEIWEAIEDLLQATRKATLEDVGTGMYHSQGKKCCYLNPCGCICHTLFKK